MLIPESGLFFIVGFFVFIFIDIFADVSADEIVFGFVRSFFPSSLLRCRQPLRVRHPRRSELPWRLS